MAVKDLLVQFFDAYLVQRNLEKALAGLSDEIISLGTGVQEVALDKEALKQLMLSEFENIPGGFKYELVNYHEHRYTDTLSGVYCGVKTSMTDTHGTDIVFETRLTMTAAQIDGVWKIINLHMSAPSDQQEGEEFFPIKYGRQAVGKLDMTAGKKLVEMMMSMLPGGIMGAYLETGLPLYIINDTMLSYLGYTYEELVEETGEQMQKIIAPEDWERVEKTITTSLKDCGEYDVQYRVVRKDGTRLWVDDKGHEILTEDGRRAMISVMLDINESIRLQERLRQEAMEDALTGILNRKGAIAGIEETLERKLPGALLLMDIDNFKQLNDTYGHQTGDQVLILLARIMKRCSREGDVAARIGGDEFLLYMPGCCQENVLKDRAASICALFKESSAVYDQVALSVSIGIAVTDGSSTFDSLFKQADDRLYEVKKSGKGSFR